jgi:hypothetical protein
VVSIRRKSIAYSTSTVLVVSACAEFDIRMDARNAHGVQGLMAAADGSEDILPFALEVGSVGMQFIRQPGFGQDFLTGGDIFRERDAHADRYDGEINNNMHRL